MSVLLIFFFKKQYIFTGSKIFIKTKLRNHTESCSKSQRKNQKFHISLTPTPNGDLSKNKPYSSSKPEDDITLKHHYNQFQIEDIEGKKNHPSPAKKRSSNKNNLSSTGLPFLKMLSMMSFEEKLKLFRKNLNELKIDWRQGFCSLTIDRENILSQSISQINKIDLYKELHINFTGEISNNAGGLIREYFTIILKELQKSNLSNKKTLI
jgi:hypothetical protein